MSGPPSLSLDSWYHIHSRGINRGDIFFEDRNHDHFLKLVEHYICPVADVFAYCLLRNHFHLLIRVKESDAIARVRSHGSSEIPSLPVEELPSKAFSNMLNAYSKAINRGYQRSGSLFQHPFRRKMLGSDAYIWAVMAYIHQNPQRHHLISDFRRWKYSSYQVLAGDEPTFLARKEIMDWFGGRAFYLSMHDKWVDDVRDLLAQEDGY
jgi:REP element-mobilizing transposase RayT